MFFLILFLCNITVINSSAAESCYYNIAESNIPNYQLFNNSNRLRLRADSERKYNIGGFNIGQFDNNY